MSKLIDRFDALASWGLNVPYYEKNPKANLVALKETFRGIKHFSVLIGERLLEGISLQDAFLIVGTAKRDAIIMECVEFEFFGKVGFYLDGSGYYKIYLPSGASSVLCDEGVFSIVDLIGDVRLRHVVRSLSVVREKVGGAVEVYWGWAKKFCGVNYLKLIVCDYSIILTNPTKSCIIFHKS